MYLKRLEMNGFKSFVEAKLEFQPGITAVVGPNGTGKSNILDAILWVLGEQSTKTLRSERMEDVIFNGTETRQPLGMGEVSLILGGVDGGPALGEGEPAALPYALSEYREVMVTRRLFRDGVSEYFINKTPCRLKDIRGLLLDTRAGSKGHTLIEQGMIDRLLKASPIERRELIEETAGIVRYKKQKAEALRKLDATNHNLLRVRDVIGEVKRQLGTLERQARAAETYQALRQEVRILELVVLLHDYREVCQERDESLRVLGDLALHESAEGGAEARLSAEVEALHLELTESEIRITALREDTTRAEGGLAQAGADLALLAQRGAFLEEQRVRVQADLVHVRGEQQEGGAQLGHLRARIDSLSRELSARSGIASEAEAILQEAMRRQRDSKLAIESARVSVMERAVTATGVSGRLASDEARAADLARQAERLDRERGEAISALESAGAVVAACIERRHQSETRLSAIQVARAGLAEGVARLMEDLAEADQQVGRLQEEMTVSGARQQALLGVTRGAGIRPLDAPEALRETVSHALMVPTEYESAIEAVLGHRLLGVLVEGPTEALDILTTLKSQGAGGGTFVPRRPRVLGALSGAEVKGAGVVGPALDLVTAREGYESLVAFLLDGVVIVETLEQAIALWPGLTRGRQAVLATLGGEVIAPDGTVTGGPEGAVVGVMSRERELEYLTGRMKQLEEELQAARAHRETLDLSLAGERACLDSSEAEARNLELSLVGERKDEQRGGQDLAQWTQRVEVLRVEQEGARAELAVLTGAQAAARESLNLLEQERAQAEQLLLARQEAVSAAEAEVEQQQAEVGRLRLEVAGLTDRLEQAQAETARIESASLQRETRVRELETEVMRLQGARTAAEAERGQIEDTVPAIEAGLQEARARMTEALERQTERVARVRALEAQWTRLRHSLDDLHRQQETVRLRQVEAQTRLEGYDALLTGTYGTSFDGAGAEVGDGGDRDIAAARETLAQRRGRLQELGPVNVMAIDEHRDLEERLRFLTAQEKDLTEAIASLKAIIARINKTTKQLFLDTFEHLQAKFNEMFRSFFEGGRAELVLVEEEEASEPGVDIVAQPPGKRLKNISMLSGGERALTAMALIFASFLIRPTPFCVLDEIDAPLDEENTVRFTRVLRDMAPRSQFIVITHSKPTMEMADSLYGVTMEEAGVSSLVSVRLNKILEPV